MIFYVYHLNCSVKFPFIPRVYLIFIKQKPNDLYIFYNIVLETTWCHSHHVRAFGCRVSSHFEGLPVYFFFHFFIPIYEVFIKMYEIETQIMQISDLRVIVNCHSLHLILDSAILVC